MSRSAGTGPVEGRSPRSHFGRHRSGRFGFTPATPQRRSGPGPGALGRRCQRPRSKLHRPKGSTDSPATALAGDAHVPKYTHAEPCRRPRAPGPGPGQARQRPARLTRPRRPPFPKARCRARPPPSPPAPPPARTPPSGDRSARAATPSHRSAASGSPRAPRAPS